MASDFLKTDDIMAMRLDGRTNSFQATSLDSDVDSPRLDSKSDLGDLDPRPGGSSASQTATTPNPSSRVWMDSSDSGRPVRAARIKAKRGEADVASNRS